MGYQSTRTSSDGWYAVLLTAAAADSGARSPATASRAKPSHNSLEHGSGSTPGSGQAPLNDFMNQVRKWLETQGYPLELKVAKAFRDADAAVLQSDYYADPETDEQREIDVRAYYSSETADRDLLRVEFLVECKRVPEKPWVLFASSRRISKRAAVAQRVGSRAGSRFLLRAAQDGVLQDLELLQLPKRTAYGLAEAFGKDQTDTPYRAMMSASKAAFATCKQYDQYRRREMYCVVAFPIVVIDGRLVECYLDTETDEIHLEETKVGTLVSRNPVVGEPHTIVTIATLAGLGSVVQAAQKGADQILALMKDSSPRLKRQLKSSLRE